MYKLANYFNMLKIEHLEGGSYDVLQEERKQCYEFRKGSR